MEYIISAIIGIVVGVIVGFVVYTVRKKTTDNYIDTHAKEAERIKEEAIKAGEAKCKEMTVEAKENILKMQTEADREYKERRQELVR